MERRKAEAMAENLSQGAYRANSWDVPSVGAVTEHATIGASIVIKGDVTGKEHLFIEGTVEARFIPLIIGSPLGAAVR
jgi:hypothetical protein